MATVTRFLLATDSVHTTAAACDYLVDRLSEGDAVTAVAVEEPGGDARDAADALNVVDVRLAAIASVETSTAEGDVAAAVLGAAADADADEIVIGARGGAPGVETDLGGTARAVLSDAEAPVVVVPLARLE
jgi:nucleotide-binding universal stress UspA family protein